jgi:hypothetical protein
MAINSYPDNSGGEVNFPDQLIDPVSKFRVSNPENLIDTDFEYGLQPTKWETVELINNTPSFFSKSGDTTIDGISSIITNAGTREITVKTELAHGLAVGIPINVTGTKSITADGAYIINSIPNPQTFTYLCKDNQFNTSSILDLYSSIITGEFFQGSQLRISDSEGIVTDAEGTSVLTVTTNTTHGFGTNTPFYFLNLNSTVAQEFQAANTASKTFDASNSATAQTFDGSNSLSSVNIDWSNSATFGGTPSTISGTNQATDTITVTHQPGENFNNLPLGTPLYYSVSATGGYFNTNPRGVVFLKTIDQLGTSTSQFQVSLVPDGDAIDLTSNLSGTFQIANQARTFAGNNIDPLTQSVINVEVGTAFNFDGGNQGYAGEVQSTPPNNTLTVLSYDGTKINAQGASSIDYYVGAMVRYSSTGAAATGLTNNTTYFITSVVNNSGGNYDIYVAALPGGSPISVTTDSGSGTQTFSRIGVSLDKNIVHVKDSNFLKGDMLEYIFPTDGRFEVSEIEEEKLFYFVDVAYDSHNYALSSELGFSPIIATGGTILPEYTYQGRTWKAHQFTTTGTSNFTVSSAGSEGIVEYLVVAGGGSGGGQIEAGGGGAGGMLTGSATVTATSYDIIVGAGGIAPQARTQGQNGSNSSFGSFATATGGGGGGANISSTLSSGANGGSGGGGGGYAGTPDVPQPPGGLGTSGQGNNGGFGDSNVGGGGGGAGAAGANSNEAQAINGNGGIGRQSAITGTNQYYAGGGGGGSGGVVGLGGLGGGGNATVNGVNNTGGGGGGGAGTTFGGNGGSGIVILRYPITPVPEFIAASATGGAVTQTTVNGVTYNVHTFTSVGTTNFVVSNVGSWNEFEYLIVGGGGGGGNSFDTDASGGGGGAGAFRQGVASLSIQTYPVVVGAGGAGGSSSGPSALGPSTRTSPAGADGQYGGNSSAFGIISNGGGGGTAYEDRVGWSNGNASGGGNGGAGGGQGNAFIVRSTAGAFGNSGGLESGTGQSNLSTSTGGGGGAGLRGRSGRANFTGGYGGDGRPSSISGTLTYYAGGGGGGASQGSIALGGNGGGGNSGLPVGRSGGNAGSNAAANRGGGGGGASSGNVSRAGGNGGSGIVIIRYPIAVATP